MNQGYFFECLNFCKVQRLPVVLVCENNGYGEYTPFEAVTAGAIRGTRRGDGGAGRDDRRHGACGRCATRPPRAVGARARRWRAVLRRGDHLPLRRPLAQRPRQVPARRRARPLARARPARPAPRAARGRRRRTAVRLDELEASRRGAARQSTRSAASPRRSPSRRAFSGVQGLIGRRSLTDAEALRLHGGGDDPALAEGARRAVRDAASPSSRSRPTRPRSSTRPRRRRARRTPRRRGRDGALGEPIATLDDGRQRGGACPGARGGVGPDER